jgi:hypothetical protein
MRKAITLPPDEIQERIAACEIELKSLRRLLLMSRDSRRVAEDEAERIAA